MSRSSLEWARAQPLPHVAKLILTTLATFADPDGLAFRSVQNLTGDASCSRSSVFTALNLLKRTGLVEVTQQGLGRGNAAIYLLRVDRNLTAKPRLTSHLKGPISEKVQSGEKVQSTTVKGPIDVPKRSNPQHHRRITQEYNTGGDGAGACATPPPPSSNVLPFPVAPPPSPAPLSQQRNAELPGMSDDDQFAAFWSRYPRRVGKGQAIKAWRSACKRLRAAHRDPAEIVAGLEARLPLFRTEVQFVKHPATWLNGQCYDDDLTALQAEASQRAAPAPRFVTDRERRGAQARAWIARQPPSEWDAIEARERAERGQDQEIRFVMNTRGEPQ